MVLAALFLLTPTAVDAYASPVEPVPSQPRPALHSTDVDDKADLIVLEDGKEIECRVLLANDEVVLAKVRGRKKEFQRSEVASIETVEQSLAELFRRLDATTDRGVEEFTQLATFCEESNLPGEARLFWIRVLLLDSENERAWTRLGGTFNSRRGWRMKVRGRYYTLEQLKERVSDWKNAMELPTSHFLVRTDIEPEDAVGIALNLERAYLTYYELLGGVLDLQNFDLTPEVHIFKDAKDYPTPRYEGDVAWFSPVANTVYVNGSDDRMRVRFQAVYVLTQALTLNSFQFTLGGTGSIPPWAQRALSEAFADAVRFEGEVARWEFGSPIKRYFVYHAKDDQPLSIKQLLGAGYGAYRNGEDARRFASQSHTFMDFLLHAEEGKYRSGLANYMRTSFKGKSAAIHLEKALGVDLEIVEVEWLEHVRETAARW